MSLTTSTQEVVRNSRDKRAISVRTIEVLLCVVSQRTVRERSVVGGLTGLTQLSQEYLTVYVSQSMVLFPGE